MKKKITSKNIKEREEMAFQSLYNCDVRAIDIM